MPTIEEQNAFMDSLIDDINYQLYHYGRISDATLAILQLSKFGRSRIRVIERELKLPITGNLDSLVENYRKLYYSKDCLNFDSPANCLAKAINSNQKEIVEDLLDTNEFDDETLNGLLVTAIQKKYNDISLILSYEGQINKETKEWALKYTAATDNLELLNDLLSSLEMDSIPVQTILDILHDNVNNPKVLKIISKFVNNHDLNHVDYYPIVDYLATLGDWAVENKDLSLIKALIPYIVADKFLNFAAETKDVELIELFRDELPDDFQDYIRLKLADAHSIQDDDNIDFFQQFIDNYDEFRDKYLQHN